MELVGSLWILHIWIFETTEVYLEQGWNLNLSHQSLYQPLQSTTTSQPGKCRYGTSKEFPDFGRSFGAALQETSHCPLGMEHLGETSEACDSKSWCHQGYAQIAQYQLQQQIHSALLHLQLDLSTHKQNLHPTMATDKTD